MKAAPHHLTYVVSLSKQLFSALNMSWSEVVSMWWRGPSVKTTSSGLCSRLSLAETNEAYLQLFLGRQFDLSNRKWQMNKLLRFCHFECYHISFLFPFFMLSWADQSLVKLTPPWTFPLRISMIILSHLEAVIKRSCVSSANNTPYANSTLRQAERVHWIVFSQWVWLFAVLTNENYDQIKVESGKTCLFSLVLLFSSLCLKHIPSHWNSSPSFFKQAAGQRCWHRHGRRALFARSVLLPRWRWLTLIPHPEQDADQELPVEPVHQHVCELKQLSCWFGRWNKMLCVHMK